MSKTLTVAGVHEVKEPEPGIVEITLLLEDRSRAVLQMNLFTFLNLWGAVRPLASSADDVPDETDTVAA